MNPYPPVSAYGGEIGVLPSDMKMRKHTVGNKTNLNYITMTGTPSTSTHYSNGHWGSPPIRCWIKRWGDR